ncbi:MAG: putative toxin-antitoxin system toxin component, PIN family [Gallionellales bacterium GWA2_60_18]|nr:MAG: putative toxin-antitoxin system toxin component, PIN family [Gallionellales bacterium GWA2_60_18]
MRVFLDTNVLVSALATRGLCAELYERLLMEHEVVIGEPVIAEVLDIMQRKFRAGKELLAKVEAELRLLEIVPAQPVAPKLPIKDREDPWIIACALAGKVDCFVTGDAELLGLGEAENLPIFSPRACWEKLSAYPST